MGNTKTEEVPVLWLQAATCTGCSVSVLNSTSPTIKNLLIDEVIPGKHVNLRFHATVMAGAGDAVIHELEETKRRFRGNYLLVVEGAVPTKSDGVFGGIGERNGRMITMAEHVKTLGDDALAVVALGTCAAFGGIPAAESNPTGCVGVGDFFKAEGIKTPLVNVPGCPPHPDWFVGTMASILLLGFPRPEELDKNGRPKAYFGKLIHENCQRRAYFDEGKFAKKLSDEGCLYELGCKGPVTSADCPNRLWNGGVNWCVGNGAPCIGCCEPGFPDIVSPLYEKIIDETMPNIAQSRKEA